MYRGWQLNDIVKDFPEVFRYTRTGPNVPRLEATSQDLADQTYHLHTRYFYGEAVMGLLLSALNLKL